MKKVFTEHGSFKKSFYRAWKFLAAAWLLLGVWSAGAAEIFFSFRAGEGGGLGRIELEDATGALIAQEAVYTAPTAREAYKVAQSPEGYAAMSINAEGPDNLVIRAPDGRVRALTIPDKLDEIRIEGRRAVVGGEEGGVFLVDLEKAEIARTWSLKDALNPPGRRPEDIRMETGGRRAWVSLQKDNKSGKREGNRVVYLDLESGNVLADLRLPRDRESLHYGREGDFRQRGPGPEIVMPVDSANTLLVTLDLYGAIGFADLAAARAGKLSSWSVQSTALDESWGTAFPDRLVPFRAGDRDFALVVNAGAAGGAAVVDVQKRLIAQRIPAPHGLSTPAFIPAARAIATASGGKLKERGSEDVEKTYQPRSEVVVFDVSADGGPLAMRTISTDAPTHALRALAPEKNALVLVSAGEQADGWLVVDIAESRIAHRFDAIGRVIRIAP